MLRQVCADRMKPDGQFMLAPDVATITDFVATLPIRKVCGIGKARFRDTSWRPATCSSGQASTSVFAVPLHFVNLPRNPCHTTWLMQHTCLSVARGLTSMCYAGHRADAEGVRRGSVR